MIDIDEKVADRRVHIGGPLVLTRPIHDVERRRVGTQLLVAAAVVDAADGIEVEPRPVAVGDDALRDGQRGRDREAKASLHVEEMPRAGRGTELLGQHAGAGCEGGPLDFVAAADDRAVLVVVADERDRLAGGVEIGDLLDTQAGRHIRPRPEIPGDDRGRPVLRFSSC